MREFAQTFLIIGGGLALLGSIPAACFAWAVHRGFNSDLTRQDYFLFFSPLLSLAAIALGVFWRKAQMRKSARRSQKLTEDTGACGDVGGLD